MTKNFTELRPGEVYENRDGVRWKVVGPTQSGWWAAYRLNFPTSVEIFRGDGRIDTSSLPPHPKNLIRHILPKQKLWMNVFLSCTGDVWGHAFDTREKADQSAGGRIACKLVEFEEGEGL